MAMASLGLGLVSLPTFGLLGVGSLVAIVLGVIALRRARRDPSGHGGGRLAAGGIVCGLLSLAAACIAIDSMRSSPIAGNESGTIGDIRSVLTAEMAYALANSGHFDRLECLAAPARCIPGFPATRPAFLDPDVIRPSRRGYTRIFHPGPAAPRGVGRASPSSMTTFAIVAVPERLLVTGTRGFCGDSTGRVCMTMDGRTPEVIAGACAPACTTLD
jgi:hypothetical protein